MPALRERRSEVPSLARAGVRRIAQSLGMPEPQFPDAFYDDLSQRNWPGNVRELMNTIERTLIRHQAAAEVIGVDVRDERPVGEERQRIVAVGVH